MATRALPDDQHIARGAMHDLRADGTEQHALDGVQATAADDDEIALGRRLDDGGAGVTLGFDQFGVQPAFGEELLRLVQIAPPLLDSDGSRCAPPVGMLFACGSADATTTIRSPSLAKSVARCNARLAASDPS